MRKVSALTDICFQLQGWNHFGKLGILVGLIRYQRNWSDSFVPLHMILLEIRNVSRILQYMLHWYWKIFAGGELESYTQGGLQILHTSWGIWKAALKSTSIHYLRLFLLGRLSLMIRFRMQRRWIIVPGSPRMQLRKMEMLVWLPRPFLGIRLLVLGLKIANVYLPWQAEIETSLLLKKVSGRDHIFFSSSLTSVRAMADDNEMALEIKALTKDIRSFKVIFYSHRSSWITRNGNLAAHSLSQYEINSQVQGLCVFYGHWRTIFVGINWINELFSKKKKDICSQLMKL